jgi:hypothetical protein
MLFIRAGLTVRHTENGISLPVPEYWSARFQSQVEFVKANLKSYAGK